MVDLETYVENIDKQYIQVLKFINDLYKHATPKVSLKNIVAYLGNNYSFSDVALYRKYSYKYTLVSYTGLLELECSTEVIEAIYNCLDDNQIGIYYSNADMKPFEDFYFEFSEISQFYEYVSPNLSKREVIDKIPPNHELVKDNPRATNIIHDVYGRTYDINQHKKNREDDYLTLIETLYFLNYSRDIDASVYDYVKLRDIARRKLLTPCFYFDGYVSSLRGDSDDDLYTEMITGYFTYRLLSEEICSCDSHMNLPNDGVMIYRVLEKQTAEYIDYDDVFLLNDKPQGLNEAEKLKLTYIEIEEIRFSKRQLESYVASLANTSQNDTPAQNDSELLVKLEKLQAENDDLNSRLSTARNTYKQHRNEIKELKEKNEKADSEKAELIEQLNRVKAELISKPADAVIHSNTDIQNIKKVAIRQFNRSLAIALTDLDYQNNLRKGDIVNFIIPHMKELAYVLADEQADKAKVLMVKYKTIYDTHLQGLEFKQGTQTKKERERVNIDLLFKKQLPVTE